ncbi:nicotinate-nucleotide adenylyltransferase [Legionella sp.]|uniref:nicotinate-nucleotide adenylyltransferase n=1 Tax=Legionella sp. TaxID=459 RepID=UPI003CA6A985
MDSLAIFGGTFDPIHNGHLQTSLNIQTHFKFDSYVFLPCKIPITKPPPLANTQQRIKMIQLAIKDYPSLNIDLREITRDSPSYMVETLESFRLEFPQAAITLIMGYDSFSLLPTWYQWKKLITLGNILVINRNDFYRPQLSELLQNFLKKYQCKEKTAILKNQSGAIFFFNAGYYEISSTKIREEIKQGKEVDSKLPKAVYHYIRDEGLY